MINLSDRVYQKLLLVPAGKVTTYKELSKACGTRAYRAVGQILKRNQFPVTVPCHRVISSSGHLGGYYGVTSGKGIERKVVLLRNEGVEIKGMKIDLDRFGYKF